MKTGSLFLLAFGVAGAAAIHRATHGIWFARPAPAALVWPAHAGPSSAVWTEWNPIPIPSPIRGVWGKRSDDVWAWATGGIMHWDGRAWTRVLAPDRSQGGVEAVVESDGWLWARTALYYHHRGGGCEPEHTSKATSDWCRVGDRWEKSECGPRSVGSPPPVPPPGPELAYVDPAELARLWSGRPHPASTPPIEPNRAYRVGGGDIWAVDETERWLAHFDGQAWTVARNQTFGLLGVWLSDPDDGWAVGDKTLFRWNGRDWTAAREAPEMLTSVWGTSAHDVWAVGVNGLVMHFDGDDWTEERLPGRVWLTKVVGRARDDVWIAGCDPTGFTAHWDGTEWTMHAIEPSGGPLDPLRGSCLRLAPGRGGGALASHGVLMFAFADGVWRDVTGPLAKVDGTPVAEGEIAALAAGSGNDVWAVGMQVRSYGEPARGALVLRFTGDRFWKKIDVGDVPDDANAVWARGPDDVWVVGARGLILHFDGRAWAREASGTDEDLTDIHGAGDTIWVVGAEGGLLRRRP